MSTDPDLSSLPEGGTLVLRVIKRPPDPPPEPGDADEGQDDDYYDEDDYYNEDDPEAEVEEYPEEAQGEEEEYVEEVEGEAEVYVETFDPEYNPEEEIVEEVDDGQANASEIAAAHTFGKKDKRVLCTKCNSSFEDYYSHFTHQKAEHKPVTCLICKVIIYGMDNLSKHCEELHGDGQRYTCGSCSATFACKLNWKRHENTHRNQVLKQGGGKCKMCHYVCATESLLSRHMHTAHRSLNDSSEYKPYMCTACGARFRFDFTYDAHMKSHSQSASSDFANDAIPAPIKRERLSEAESAAKRIKLDVDAAPADTETVSSAALLEDTENLDDDEQYQLDKSHLVMTTDRPFKCTKCSESFRWKVSLQVHMRVHDDTNMPMNAYMVAPSKQAPVGPVVRRREPVYLMKPSKFASAEAKRIQDQINRMASQRTVIYRPNDDENSMKTQGTIENQGPVPVSIVSNQGNKQGTHLVYTTNAPSLQDGASVAIEESALTNNSGPLYIQGPDGQLLELRPSETQEVAAGEAVMVVPQNGTETVEAQESQPQEDGTVQQDQLGSSVKLEHTEEYQPDVQDNTQFLGDGNVLVTEGEPSEQMMVMPTTESNEGEMIMTSLRLQNEAWCGNLCSTLLEMQRNKTMCNVTLVGSDGQSVSGHSCLVAAASPCLKDLLTGVKSGAHSVLKFDTISSDLWQLLIEFIYSGKVEVPIANVSDIMMAATHLQIEGLATLCADLLQQYNATDNIIVQLQIEDWSTHVCGMLHQFWQTQTMYDTTLTTGDGEQAFTLACVLAAASPTFRSILSSMKQGMYNIKTDQISKATWDYLFQFMFNGECEVPVGKDLVTLYQATDQLSIAPLKSLCADCIESLGPSTL